MRHQLPLSSFQLSPTDVKPLLQLIQAHRTPQAVVRRARIVLAVHAHPDWSSQRLAQLLELNPRLVRKWRHRGPETHSRKRSAQIRSTSSFSRSGSRPGDRAGLQPPSLAWDAARSLESR